MKKGWDKYAVEKRYVQKGYLRKYRNGNPSWKAPEASSSNSFQQSRKSQKEELNLESLLKDEVYDLSEYGKYVLLTEEVVDIGDENGQSEVRIGEPVQSSGESSSQVGSSESSSRSGKSRNSKVRQRKNGKDGIIR